MAVHLVRDEGVGTQDWGPDHDPDLDPGPGPGLADTPSEGPPIVDGPQRPLAQLQGARVGVSVRIRVIMRIRVRLRVRSGSH